MGLRADSTRPQRVAQAAQRVLIADASARNPIAAHVKFGDDCANAQPGLSQWMAALSRSYEILAFIRNNLAQESFRLVQFWAVPAALPLRRALYIRYAVLPSASKISNTAESF